MLYNWFLEQNHVLQAFLATMFTWFLTAAGAALVFFFKEINRRLLDGMLGFAAGVMIAASYWSLLAPAIEMAENSGQIPWVRLPSGFLSGGLFLWLTDHFLHKINIDLPKEIQESGNRSSWHRSLLLILAITLHNIPEGLAVGVAFWGFGLRSSFGHYWRGHGSGSRYRYSKFSGRYSRVCSASP